MKTKAFLKLSLLCVCILGMTSCSDNDLPKNQQTTPIEQDWRLVGEWKLDHTYNSQSNAPATVISLNADGSGSSSVGDLTWYTSNDKLVVTFAEGTEINTSYTTYGALLSIDDYAVYTADIPIVGTWYAPEASKEFTGTDMIYSISSNGNAVICSFSSDGCSKYEKAEWSRTQDGICLTQQGKEQNWEYSVNDGTLSIKGKGEYVNTPTYEGLWKAVDSSEGVIQPEDTLFSTVKILKNADNIFFICHYQYLSESNQQYYPWTYQTIIKPVFNVQQQLFILLPNGSHNDSKTLEFRFYYSKENKKVYLDLSTDINFNRYIRYEYQDQE